MKCANERGSLAADTQFRLCDRCEQIADCVPEPDARASNRSADRQRWTCGPCLRYEPSGAYTLIISHDHTVRVA